MIRLAEHGALSQRRLGELQHTDRTSMTKFADSLESAGYVRRVRDPADRRAYELSLTAVGKRSLDQARELIDGVERDLTSSWSDRQREQVRALLARAVDEVTVVSD